MADHGEVFTADREVTAMLDLVKQEAECIDSRFLEPACGTGNFLAEILHRKLAVVKTQYYPDDFEGFAVFAVTSLYGIDLLQDNIDECRSRLFTFFDQEYRAVCGASANEETRIAVRHILKHNILCGNALTLKTPTGQPIVFAEWSLVDNRLLKRRDFRLDQLLEGPEQQYTRGMKDWVYDEERNIYVPLPFREFPLVHYRKIQQYE